MATVVSCKGSCGDASSIAPTTTDADRAAVAAPPALNSMNFPRGARPATPPLNSAAYPPLNSVAFPPRGRALPGRDAGAVPANSNPGVMRSLP